MKNTKIGMGIMIAGLIFAAGCNMEKKQVAAEKEIVRPAIVIEAKTEVKTVNTNFTGSVSAVSQTKLSFKVGGNIKKIYVNMGEKVKKGQLIAELDNKDYNLQLQTVQSGLKTAKLGIEEAKTRMDQANSALEHSKAQVEQAQTGVENAKVQYDTISKKFERISKMYEDGTASLNDFESAKMTRDSAKLGLNAAITTLEQAKTGVKNALVMIEQAKVGMAAAEAQTGTVSSNVEMATNQVNYSKLYSPDDGYVAMKTAEENENIGAGMPVVILTTGENYEVKIFVPEVIVSKLAIGQSANVKIDAAGNKTFEAKIKEIGNSSTGFGITFPVTLSMNGLSGKLRPGMTAEVKININDSLTKEAVYLPMSAILKDTKGTFVFVTENNDSETILKKRYIITGEITDGGVEVISGLKPKEEVLAAGVRFAFDGQKVKPQKEEEK